MTRSIAATLALLLASLAAQAQSPAKPVPARVETTLATGGPQIRQYLFDGDDATFFASAKNATKVDHVTLVFDEAVAVKSVAVSTGKPNGGDELAAGTLEVSADGKGFEKLAAFEKGTARGDAGGKKVLAVRVVPADDLTHPLTVREVVVDSEPKLTTFKYPVEVVPNVDDAPDMKEWAEKAARVCERQYGMICEELASDNFKPLTLIPMTLKKDYKGVAFASGGRITGSVDFFKKNPNDIGAMVHETVHCVQLYRGRGNPGWLVEGVADYLRFFKYEAKKPNPLTPERAKHDGSYRVTAAFLDYVEREHTKGAVKKLNAAMREGKYKEELWKDVTGKTLVELAQMWKASLAK